jgi:CheY-like chemotaxis protein/predicted transcriptional regulator
MSSPSSSHIQFAELERDNIGGQRSKIDVIATILYICNNGSLKNHIVGKGNFSDSMANHYISILLYNELLSTYVDNENNGRTYYRTTDKGRGLIYHYNQIQRLFATDKDHQINETQTQTKTRSSRNAIPSSDAQSAAKRLLIIDDEEDITSALKAGLEKYGIDVDVSNNPVSTLSNYKPGYYDLVILDIRMPNMDGFELYKVIRKLDNKTKICFWTAFEVAFEQFLKMFPTMNEQYFIKKPITLDDLVNRIDKLIVLENQSIKQSSSSSSDLFSSSSLPTS